MFYFPLIGFTNGNTDLEKAKVPACKAWNVQKKNFNHEQWTSQGGWLGAVYTDGEIVVDIDDKNMARRIINLGLKGCQINTTPKGCHLIYKSSPKKIKNKTKVICAAGIEVDYRTSKKGYIVYPSGQENRKIVQTGIEYEMPEMFLPTTKKGFDLVTNAGEGGRNSALNSWGWFICKNGFTPDILFFTNKLLSDPLETEEVAKIIGSVSKAIADNPDDEKKTSKVKVLVDAIINDHDLMFDGFVYRQYNGLFWDEISIFAIEKLIYEYGASSLSQMNNVKSRLRAEVLHENAALSGSRKLNLLNGVLDIDTRELTSHDKDLYFNYVINSEYCQKQTDSVTKFISNIIGDDQLNIFKKMCGKILLQNNQKCEAAFFWQGTNKGGNGKGTLLTLINELFGHATANISFDNLDERFGLGNIEGKLLLLDSDFNNTLIRQTERYKKLVSGEPVAVEYKNIQTKKEVRFNGTILVLTNYLPTVSVSGSGGFYRRSNLIKFMKNISDSTDNDPEIKEKILNMKVEFLNFCLEGLDLLIADKYIISRTKETTEEWELANDPLRVWLTDEYVECEGNEINTDVIYENFNGWVYAYGEKKKSRSQFLRVIARVFPKVINRRVRRNNDRIFVLIGIKKKE
jgi:P4 family phage/plasmid primase-like protien